MSRYGSHSEVLPITRLVLKDPRAAFGSQARIEEQWQSLNYTAPPDLDRALEEYDRFVALLGRFVPEIHFIPGDSEVGLDSIYVRDTALVTREGVVLARMGKTARAGEPSAMARFLDGLGVPVLGEIGGDGRLEGGDVVWLDERTLVVGHGYRTNGEGIRQLEGLVSELVDEVVVVPLPHWRGPDDVLHLMSFLSPVDHNLALVYSPLMPVPFRQWLLRRGTRLVEVPDEEYSTMGCNVLAVAPGQCIMLAGNPETRRRLEAAGVEIWEYDGQEISLKGSGGPTCLTRPLLRRPGA